MQNKFKPEGYNSLSPYLIVDGAKRLSELLEKIFGATELRSFQHEDGSIQHSEFNLDDSVIMISDSLKEYPASKAMLHVYVRDVFKTLELALENRCEVLEHPRKTDDGDIRGGFQDFAGNQWYVSTQTME